MNICAIEGCEREAEANGVCQFHHVHQLNIEKERNEKEREKESRPPPRGIRPKHYDSRLTYNGVTKLKAEWALELGMCETTFYSRLQKWPLEKAMTEPVNKRKAGSPGRPKILIDAKAKIEPNENR